HRSKTSYISSRSVVSKAEDQRRETERLSKNSGTPIKGSNNRYSGKPPTRQEVIDGFKYELLDCRWDSMDLVDHTFGQIVQIPLSASIQLAFLHFGIIVVKVGKNVLGREKWPEACASAALLARWNSTAESLTKKQLAEFQSFSWEWNLAELRTGSEIGAENFFNGVGMLAYVAAALVDPDALNNRKPTIRFTTLPRHHHALPIPSSDKQDTRPDFLSFLRSAFFKEAERDETRLDEFLEKPSMLRFLQKCAPGLAAPYIAGWSGGSLDGQVFPILPEASPDDDDVAGGPTPSDDDEETGTIFYSQLLERLQDLDALLKADLPAPPQWVIDVVRDYSEARFLDFSRVCFPNIMTTGESKQTNMAASMVQESVYMRQQRRVQPWMRSILGLMTTKDKVGLLRSDPAGLEQCVLKKNTGHGIIEIIRLTLGLLVATEGELGVHPCCTSFREVKIPVPESHRNAIQDDSSDQEDPPSPTPATIPLKRSGPSSSSKGNKKLRKADASFESKTFQEAYPPPPSMYQCREVNIITLDNSLIHTDSTKLAEKRKQTRYYVKYLLEDRGSLVGRCTRIWCVYEEVVGETKVKLAREHQLDATKPIFVGPYALKFYCADIRTEAYSRQIFDKAAKEEIRHVLLPTKVWYLGKIMNVVRGLNEGVELPGVVLRDREEVVTISAFKRTLDQFETAYEFYGALIGVLKAIESLAQAEIIHRDISPGNILLDEEKYTTSERYVEIEIKLDDQATEIFLVRRVPVSLNAIGGLHDLDMAATLALPSETTSTTLLDGIDDLIYESMERDAKTKDADALDFRTGTTPYISIPVLSKIQKAHNVYDDLQSTFFVHYLSLFSYNDPKPNCYPERPTQHLGTWPDECLAWADSPGVSISDLGAKKRNFFEADIYWLRTARQYCQQSWKGTKRVRGKDIAVLADSHTEMLLAVQSVLWDLREGCTRDWQATYSATPRQVIDAMENALEKNKHLLGWVAPLDDLETRARPQEEGVSCDSDSFPTLTKVHPAVC
ncbi:hypothetical protein H0H81_012024, partial [Sphagnurus paluster]